MAWSCCPLAGFVHPEVEAGDEPTRALLHVVSEALEVTVEILPQEGGHPHHQAVHHVHQARHLPCPALVVPLHPVALGLHRRFLAPRRLWASRRASPRATIRCIAPR
jgi:hypothetical protein